MADRPTMNLFEVCRDALAAWHSSDIDGVELYIQRIWHFGPTGMRFLMFAVPWSLSLCAQSGTLTEVERQRVVDSVMRDSEWSKGLCSRGSVTAMVDYFASGGTAAGRIPADEVYFVFLAVLHCGLFSCPASADWTERFDRLVSDFKSFYVTD